MTARFKSLVLIFLTIFVVASIPESNAQNKIPKKKPCNQAKDKEVGLKSSMSMNKNLKAFIARGVFDLVTPYFGSVVVTRQMSLDPCIGENLTLKVYEGEHMFYTHGTSRKAFFEDARRFFQQAATQT
jgi:carboxypeptidase C (cathepsin A)